MKRIVLWLAAASLVLFVALQMVRPEINHPPVTSELQAPEEVKAILKNSCYNCHSNETRLSWFDQIVPAYWLVASDVKRARTHLNFSELGSQPASKRKGILFEAVNQIQLGAMPLPSYRRMHPEAVITEGQLAILRSYLLSMAPAPASTLSADEQFSKWLSREGKPASVRDTLTGVKFLSEYKNWRAISSTARFDNGTMRVILGNPVATRAIAANQINPWPDGTAFAKVAWYQQADENGSVRTGAFQQVELMIKDTKKYAATKGWGWGRWRGAELQPYGDGPDYVNECVSCHLPVSANDYVYTMPIGGQQ